MSGFRLMLCMISLLLLVGSCKREDGGLKRLDFGVFRLNVPLNWRHIKKNGIDSQIGQITNGKDRLDYDYGWYASQFTKETPIRMSGSIRKLTVNLL